MSSFQIVSKMDGWDKETQLHVLRYLYRVRSRKIDPEALDQIEIPEVDFAVSSNDLLYNVIEVKRARRAIDLGNFDQPRHRDQRSEVVSDLKNHRSVQMEELV